MPPASARFVVIGLTNGPAFHPNPCLAAQVDYARSRHLWAAAYAVLTYPTRGQLRTYGGPREAGRAQARQNVAAMRAVGLPAPIVWVDVEPVSPPAPWSPRVRVQPRGAGRARSGPTGDAGLRVGFYSTRSMWRGIVGRVRPGRPSGAPPGCRPGPRRWRAAAAVTRSRVDRPC